MNLISFLTVILIKMKKNKSSIFEMLKKANCNFNNSNIIEKFNIILNPSTPEDIKTVVSFIQQLLEQRK